MAAVINSSGTTLDYLNIFEDSHARHEPIVRMNQGVPYILSRLPNLHGPGILSVRFEEGKVLSFNELSIENGGRVRSEISLVNFQNRLLGSISTADSTYIFEVELNGTTKIIEKIPFGNSKAVAPNWINYGGRLYLNVTGDRGPELWQMYGPPHQSNRGELNFNELPQVVH